MGQSMEHNQKPIFLVANWKMNPVGKQQACELARAIEQGVHNTSKVQVVVCPPALYLDGVAQQTTHIAVGAQNCFYEASGAFTGEVSPVMLEEMGCAYVILGHAEVRALGESNELINKKLKFALEKTNLVPIVAVGSQSKDEVDELLKEQVEKAFEGVSSTKAKRVILAYEPVWAIGTGETPSTNQVMSVRIFIQKILQEMYNTPVAQSIPFLYGGSTSAQNCVEFVQSAGTDGLLVGGASLRPAEFIKMFENLVQITP